MGHSPPGSSAHGIFQARILERIAISNCRDLPNQGIEPMSLVSPALADRFFTTMPPGKSEKGILDRKEHTSVYLNLLSYA